MQLFYKPDISGSSVNLDETESKHCVKVLRLATGEQVQFIDGKGCLYTAKITDANSRQCKLEIIHKEKDFGKKDFYIHIAIAPTKNIERFEWFLEKATEIGIGEITPILSEHSERKIVNNDRFEKIMVSAIKQSVKAYLPKLNQLTGFENFIKIPFEGLKFIAHCNEGEKVLLQDSIGKNKDVLILIGPEGDFSEREVRAAMDNGFVEISLGQARLRTETAGIVACHTVNLINE
jgi:16S rRNA (uracil1498-N3)-methyltransferase